MINEEQIYSKEILTVLKEVRTLKRQLNLLGEVNIKKGDKSKLRHAFRLLNEEAKIFFGAKKL